MKNNNQNIYHSYATPLQKQSFARHCESTCQPIDANHRPSPYSFSNNNRSTIEDRYVNEENLNISIEDRLQQLINYRDNMITSYNNFRQKYENFIQTKFD